MMKQLSTLKLGGRRVDDEEKSTGSRDGSDVSPSPMPRSDPRPLTPRHKQLSKRSLLSASNNGGLARQGSSRPGMMKQLSSLVLGQKDPKVDPQEATERLQLEAKRNERLEKIAALESSRLEKAKSLEELRAELAELKKRQTEDLYFRKLEVDTIQCQQEALAERVQVFKNDMYDKDSLQQYANLIKEAAPKSVNSSYVMRLQKQLSKATKKMEAMDQQMQIVQNSGNDVAASLKQEFCEIIDERVRSELKLKEQMTELEERMLALEKEFKDRVKANDFVISSLENRDVRGDGTGATFRDKETTNVAGFKRRMEQEDERSTMKEELGTLAVTKGCDENEVREAINRRKEQLVATIVKKNDGDIEKLTPGQTEEAEIPVSASSFEANGVGVEDEGFDSKDGGNNGGPPIPPPSAFAMPPIGRSMHASDSGMQSLGLSDAVEDDEEYSVEE